MKSEYMVWITEYLKNNDPKLRCKEATGDMKQQFPELIKVRGHVIGALNNTQRPHWWLIDPITQEIIDPTESQFLMILKYIPHDETQPEPTGKCPNCGEYCYDYSSVCSDECAEEYKRYLNTCKL